LSSLRTALAADPGNAHLARALEETERAVRLIEMNHVHPGTPGVSSGSDR
jgi:hypothetical protein